MGQKKRKSKKFREEENEDEELGTIFVNLSDIKLSEKNRNSLKRDHHQIEALRQLYEADVELPPIVLIAQQDGSYEVDDGRHRFLAQELAGFTSLEAVVINGEIKGSPFFHLWFNDYLGANIH